MRLLHTKGPGRNFADDFDKYPQQWSRLERRLHPRVHLKYNNLYLIFRRFAVLSIKLVGVHEVLPDDISGRGDGGDGIEE